MNFLDFFQLDNLSAWLLFLMLLGFPLGYAITDISRLQIIRSTIVANKHSTLVLRSLIFWVCCFIACVVLFVDDLVIIRQLASGMTFHDIAAYGERIPENTGLQVVIKIFIVYPVMYAVSPICAVEYFSNNSKKMLFLMINVIIVALSVLQSGGRVLLIQVLLSYIIAYLVYGKSFKTSLFSRFIIVAFLIGTIFFFINVSESRGIDNLLDSLYLYLVGSVPHMVARISYTNIADLSTNGFLSLNGFLYPLFVLLNGLDIVRYPLAFELTQSVLIQIEQDVMIGSFVTTNAFLPPIFYLYSDFGIVGSFIGMILYGSIMRKSLTSISQARNKRNMAIFIILLIGVSLSFIRLWSRSYHYTLAVVFILLMYTRKIEFNKNDKVILPGCDKQ